MLRLLKIVGYIIAFTLIFWAIMAIANPSRGIGSSKWGADLRFWGLWAFVCLIILNHSSVSNQLKKIDRKVEAIQRKIEDSD